MAENKPNKKREVTDAHKAAMAQGREEGRAIKRYLEALEASAPQRGRPVDPDRVKARLDQLATLIPEADPLNRVQLTQERIDLLTRLETVSETVNMDELETAFVAAAAGYSERKSISYKAWREVGVPADVLKRAGITRSS